jgi:hypothetical protein
MSKRNKLSSETEGVADKERRAFLRKSVYAVYATPVITALLVNNASAAQSWNNGNGRIPDNNSNDPYDDD